MGGALRNFGAFVLTLIFFSHALASPLVESQARDEQRKLSWRGPITLSVSSSFYSQSPNIKVGSDVSGALERSIQTWNNTGYIEIRIDRSSRQDVSPSGRSGDGVSLLTVAPTAANTLFFGGSENIPARSRIFYSRRNSITEADIVLNPAVQFSTDGSYGTFDLETVLTHEIGHLLGLKHSFVPSSIMYDSIVRNGAIAKEFVLPTLSRTDVSELRSIYTTETGATDRLAVITGRSSTAVRKDARFEIWAVDTATGGVAAVTTLSRGRSFKLEGLDEGTYEVFSQAYVGSQPFERRSLGRVEVAEGERITMSNEVTIGKPVAEIVAIGKQGVLSDRMISLPSSTRTNILIALDTSSSGDVSFEVESPFVNVDLESIVEVDHADGVRTWSAWIEVDSSAAKGSYTICAISSDAKRSCVPGGLLIK